MGWGRGKFRKLGLNVKTNLPAGTLVTNEAFRFSRNPMYVGFVSILAGLGLAAGSLPMLLSAIPMFLYLDWYVIRREENTWDADSGSSTRPIVKSAPLALGCLMASKKRHATGEELHDLFHEVFALHDALSEVMDDVHARPDCARPSAEWQTNSNAWAPATVPDVAASLNVSRQFVQDRLQRPAKHRAGRIQRQSPAQTVKTGLSHQQGTPHARTRRTRGSGHYRKSPADVDAAKWPTRRRSFATSVRECRHENRDRWDCPANVAVFHSGKSRRRAITR